jgi:hypothetical protein
MFASKVSTLLRRPGWTAWLTVAIILVAVSCAARKASLAAITTDEAYNFNGWVTHGPRHIWSDYSAANNHMVHTLTVWLSTQVFGIQPWALRLSSVCSFALELCCVALIADRAIGRAWLRPIAVGFVALHPYFLDFGALARGYTLGTSFLLLGVWLLMRVTESLDPETRVRRELALAGLSFAVANGVVPLMMHATVGAGLSYLYLGLRRVGLRKVTGRLLSLTVPGGLLLFLIYSQVFRQFRRGLFRFGADSVRTSLTSLHKLFVYEPQALVDRGGNPILDGVSVHPWHQGLLPEAFSALFSHGLGIATLALCFALTVLGGLLPASTRPEHSRKFIGLIVLCMSLSTAAQFTLARVPLPLHRTWFPFALLVLLGTWIAVDRVAERLPLAGQRCFSLVLGPIALAFGLHLVDHISFAGFREWPDNAPIPQLLTYIADARDGRRVRIGYPWYQEACFIYYRTQRGYAWLTLPDLNKAESASAEFVVVNSYVSARRYPKHHPVIGDKPFLVELLHRPGKSSPATSPPSADVHASAGAD